MQILEQNAQEEHRGILARQANELETAAQQRHNDIVSADAKTSQQEMPQWAKANEALAADRQHILRAAKLLEHERNSASGAARHAFAENDKLRLEARQQDAQLQCLRD